MLLLVLWWCCWCWSAFRGWWGLRSALYHPPGSSFWAYRSPQSEGQEPKTAPFICQNDNHWQWWPSYLTQGRLQRQFVPLWPAVGRTLLCNFKEGWTKSGLGEGRGRGAWRGIVWWRDVGIEIDKWKGERKKRTPGPSHFLIKHSRLRLQHVSEVQTSIM